MRNISTAACVRAAAIGLFVSSAAYGAAQTNPYHFYLLGNSALTMTQVNALANANKLRQVAPQGTSGFNGGVYQMADGSVRLVFVGGPGGGMAFLPDLRQEQTPLPPNDTAVLQRQATDFMGQYGFLPQDKVSTWALGNTTFWRKQSNTPAGGPSTPMDLIGNVRFTRMIGNIPCFGPRSSANVQMDANGPVGASVQLLPAVQDGQLVPAVKTADQVTNEFNLLVANYFSSATPKVTARRTIYFEQGMKYIQPAVFFDVLFTDKNGFRFTDYVIVPLATNCPEFVAHYHELVAPPIFPPQPNPLAMNQQRVPDNWAAGMVAAQANPVNVGEYVVRNDDAGWVNDANNFWGGVSFSNAIGFFLHPGVSVNRPQYYWDNAWMWEAADGYGDNSPFFPGSNQFDLIEGHGAPWEITCLRNNADIIHLNQLAGFGANGPYAGEKTCYIMWQSCDVIPEPGHAFDGDFQSGTAWDVWWKVFKGMRMNFGYRTLMHIWNGAGGIFGSMLGFKCQLVPAWLSATDSTVFSHSSGWDYGSVVLIPGHEGDNFYNTGQLPPATSTGLTMWWIHA